MKIAMLSPTSMSGSDEAEQQRKTREAFLQRLAPDGMEITLIDNPEGPRAIETTADEYNSIPGMLKAAVKHEKEFDGYITGCFGEPGLDAVRELVSIPAVGCCGPAIHMANIVGRRFAVLSPVKTVLHDTTELVLKYGLGKKLALVTSLDIPVLEIRKNRDKVVRTAGEMARRIAADHEVDVFVLGCMSLAYQDVAGDVAAICGVPVINPLHTSLSAVGYLAGRLR